MIGIEEIRTHALALPAVSEATHFNLPAFKVRDKSFVVIQKGGTHAILSLDEAQAAATVAEEPDAYQVVRRNDGRIFVGVRVDLARACGGRLGERVEQAWRNKAPGSLSIPSRGS